MKRQEIINQRKQQVRPSKVRRKSQRPKNKRPKRRNGRTKIKLSKRAMKWILALIFLLGIATVSFPVVSQFLYHQAATQIIADFDQEVEILEDADVTRRMELARGYNEAVNIENLKDPFNQLQKDGVAEYARMLEVNEQIGTVTIPKIDVELPTYAGTTENVLQKGVGHLEGTSLPIGGESTHAVITAHRGLPTARLFTDLNKIEEGDVFYFKNIRETIAYQVDQIKVVEPNAIDEVAVVEGKDYITLLTCTPYMINSHRLLVRGHRIPYEEAKVVEEQKEQEKPFDIRDYAWQLLLSVILVGMYLIWKYARKK